MNDRRGVSGVRGLERFLASDVGAEGFESGGGVCEGGVEGEAEDGGANLDDLVASEGMFVGEDVTLDERAIGGAEVGDHVGAGGVVEPESTMLAADTHVADLDVASCEAPEGDGADGEGELLSGEGA
jgi:hypothetical protein